MSKKSFTCIIAIVVAISCSAQTIVKSNDPHIHYMGRVDVQDTAAVLSWPGSSVKINFEGTGISALLKDEKADNYYNVIVDDHVVSVLHFEKEKKLYNLVSGLPAGKHNLELFKRTEWEMGKTWFYRFELDKNSKILYPDSIKKKKVEFFGNSITCGYADEDTSGKDRGISEYENSYISYAAITARHYNADFNNTSKSGIGVTVSWFPLIMPEMYDRLDGTDPKSKWDFSKYTPDLVVINLFQNDSWIVKLPDNPQFKARFGTVPPTADFIIKLYRNFVQTIRVKYPKAAIVCILGSMDATKDGSPWPGYIDKAVAGLNDKNIYTHFIPYKNTQGHPSAKEQQAMADNLIGYIDRKVNW